MKKIYIIFSLIMIVLMSGCEKVSEIDKRISEMNLKDKITQMIMPSVRYETYEIRIDENGKETVSSKGLESLNEEWRSLFNEYKFAGMILFAENLQSSEDGHELIQELKEINGEDQLPLLIAVDQEGGYGLD